MCGAEWREVRWHPIRKGLLGISKELQFRVCNNGELYASPCTGREGELFYREEKEVEGAIVNRESMAFIG